MGHKVINCQLPDGLEPEEIIEEMSHGTLLKTLIMIMMMIIMIVMIMIIIMYYNLWRIKFSKKKNYSDLMEVMGQLRLPMVARRLSG